MPMSDLGGAHVNRVKGLASQVRGLKSGKQPKPNQTKPTLPLPPDPTKRLLQLLFVDTLHLEEPSEFDESTESSSESSPS